MQIKLIAEFSEKWLKVALVHLQGARSQVKSIILEPLEPNFSNVSDALNKVLAQVGKKKNIDVTVVLSRNKITVRKIDLPSREPNEIEQMLGFHVIRQVPYPKEEIVWGYQNLGFDGISKSHILLAIVHRDLLRNIFNAFTALNIVPEKMLLSSDGVLHYVRASLKDSSLMQQPCLILDVDYNYSDLMLINKQQLDSSVVISQVLEQLKSEEGKSKFTADLKICFSLLQQSLLSLRADLSGKPIRLFLTGAAENINQLGPYLESELNLKTYLVKSKDIESLGLAGKDASFAAVLGFSYQQRKEDILFLLPEVQIKREIKEKVRQMMTMGIYIVYIFILLGLLSFSKLNQRQAYRERLVKQVVGLKENAGELVGMSQKIERARQYLDKKYSVLNYLDELLRICPENITLTNLSWDRQKGFSIRGWAYQMPDIFSFAGVLDSSKPLKGMQTRSTRRHKVKDKEVVDFEMGAR